MRDHGSVRGYVCTCGQIHARGYACAQAHASRRAREQARDRIRAAQPQRRAHHTRTHTILRQQVFTRDAYTCVHCGRDVMNDPTLDYLIPLQDGGAQDESNAVTACRSCNSSAGRRTRRRVA